MEGNARTYLGDTVPVLTMSIKRAQNQRVCLRILVHEQKILVHLPRIVGHVSLLRLSGIYANTQVARVGFWRYFRSQALLQTELVDTVQTEIISVYGQPPSNRLQGSGIHALRRDSGFLRLINRTRRALLLYHDFATVLIRLYPLSFSLRMTATHLNHHCDRVKEFGNCRRHHLLLKD